MPGADCAGNDRRRRSDSGETGNLHEPEWAFGAGVGSGTSGGCDARSDCDLRRAGFAAGYDSHPAARILGALNTDEFLRIRLGIAPDRKVGDTVKYVLTPFRKAQEVVVDEVLDMAAQAVEVILKEGPAAAMNRFNRKNETGEEPQ